MPRIIFISEGYAHIDAAEGERERERERKAGDGGLKVRHTNAKNSYWVVFD